MNDIEEKLRAISLRLRTESRRDDIPLSLGDTCEDSADELLTLADRVAALTTITPDMVVRGGYAVCDYNDHVRSLYWLGQYVPLARAVLEAALKQSPG